MKKNNIIGRIEFSCLVDPPDFFKEGTGPWFDFVVVEAVVVF